MPTVASVYGLRHKDGDVGVEIEVEGRRLPAGEGLWRREIDGSLKPKDEAAEYVLKSPVNIADLPAALNNLKQMFNSADSVIDNTYRAGIHVHVNVQDLNIPQVFNFILLHVIFEDAFLNFCREDRRSNHFCLPSADAEWFLEKLWEAADKGNLRVLQTDELRYSAVNFQSLPKYGSLEFRALESTTDFDKINTWAQILVHLRESAKVFKDPRDMLTSFSMHGYAQLTDRVFGKWSGLVYDLPDWQRKVKAGVRRAQDIAFSRHWGSVNLNIFAKEENVF